MRTIVDIVKQVSDGEISARQQVEMSLAKAKNCSQYNAILSLCEQAALSQADAIDKKIAAGEAVGVLAGVPFLAKDNFLTLNGVTTAGSKILENFEAPLEATAIKKLVAADAICIGKTNLDSFGHGGSTENSAFGPTKNAFDTSRVAGGSSGGSAVAVALEVVPFALATDTGGSTRQPASFNGVIGVKPTYGMISRYGVIAMASSTDVVGLIASNIEGAEIVLDVLAGDDDHDPMTLPDYFKPLKQKVSPKKVGIIKELMGDSVDTEVATAVDSYCEALKKNGHTVEEVSLPLLDYALAMYYIIVPAEISSNLSRFDGIRYGVRAPSKSLEQVYEKSREQGFEAENQRRIMIGNYVLSSGYFDAYYNKAQKARTLLTQAYGELFKSYDVLLGPVAPSPAFKLGAKSKDPLKMYMADVMTVGPSLANLPAISVPAGKSKAGLPIGVQLISQTKTDAALLSFAKSIEGAMNG